MLTILNIWLCIFFRNASILDKMPILGQAPRKEYILTTIATRHEMIKGTGKMNRRVTCHADILKVKRQNVTPDPVLAKGIPCGIDLPPVIDMIKKEFRVP